MVQAGVSPVSESCSNTFTFWLLHTVIEADLPRLLFEEWRLHRQYTDRVSVLALKKLSGEQVTCAEYSHQLLAIGVRSGAVRLYQADVQVRGDTADIARSGRNLIVRLPANHQADKTFTLLFVKESRY